MDIKQQEIYQKLLKIDKKAAEAYKGALKVLEDRENPDRFSQSAHSLREVTALISRKVSIPQETKESKESLRKKLEKKFIENPDLLPFPSEEKSRALIREWGNLHDFFVAIAHHGRDVSEEDFFSKLADFEAILLQFLKPVPITLEELDSLLSIQSPKQDDIKKLSELLKHPTHVEYFFSKLTSPHWLMPLKEHGFFSKPPSGIREGNYIIFPVWPLSKYLIKVAGHKPREVMDIIKSMQETDNFRVHIDLIHCALQMPSSIAKEIIPLAKKWMATPYSTLIPTKLGELTTKLGNEGEMDYALALLEILLDVKYLDEESKEILLREAIPNFDLWEYEQNLTRVVPIILQKEPCRVIKILCDVLYKAINLEMRVDGKSPNYDFSYIWRPAIEDHPQNGDLEDVKNLLVTTIRDSFETIGKKDEKIFRDCYKLLSKYDYPVYRRLELHLMRTFPDLLKNEIQSILSDKKAFKSVHLWHEYYHLLREQFSKLPQDIMDNILKWIEEGPDLERFESLYKEEGFLPTQEEKDAYKAQWQIRYLSAIKDSVPPEWKKKWNKLVNKYGELEHPDFYSYSEIKVGPTSPLTKEEIKKMSPQEIVKYLKTWKPPKEPFAPSMEGFGRILSEIISENPCDYVEVCQEFKTLHPAYIYHFIGGFREAIKKGNVFEWKAVIQLCKDILTISELSNIPNNGDKYYNWKSVKRAIADLLEGGLKSKVTLPSFELKDAIWEIIEILLHDDEPNLNYEKEYLDEHMNPVTLSLNTVRGKTMHALIQYALWCARQSNLSESDDKITLEVKEKLEKMLDPEFEPTKTIRCVYGLYFPILFYLNKDWAIKHIPTIFPQNNRSLWRAAWEAYITYSKYFDDIYKAMRLQYKIAINKLSSPKISVKAKERLSEHLMMAYLKELEKLEDDSLIRLFFERAQPEIKGHAIWFVGKILSDLSESDLENKIDKTTKGRIIKQAMNLWEWRIEEIKKVNVQTRKDSAQELKWFGMWFIYSPFDKTWAISQLRRTLELTGGIIEFTNDIVVKFQNYIEEHHLEVLKVLILLIKGDAQRWLLITSKEKIEELIDRIIKEHSHQEIKDPINELVNELTRKGYHEFAKFFIK